MKLRTFILASVAALCASRCTAAMFSERDSVKVLVDKLNSASSSVAATNVEFSGAMSSQYRPTSYPGPGGYAFARFSRTTTIRQLVAGLNRNFPLLMGAGLVGSCSGYMLSAPAPAYASASVLFDLFSGQFSRTNTVRQLVDRLNGLFGGVNAGPYAALCSGWWLVDSITVSDLAAMASAIFDPARTGLVEFEGDLVSGGPYGAGRRGAAPRTGAWEDKATEELQPSAVAEALADISPFLVPQCEGGMVSDDPDPLPAFPRKELLATSAGMPVVALASNIYRNIEIVLAGEYGVGAAGDWVQPNYMTYVVLPARTAGVVAARMTSARAPEYTLGVDIPSISISVSSTYARGTAPTNIVVIDSQARFKKSGNDFITVQDAVVSDVRAVAATNIPAAMSVAVPFTLRVSKGGFSSTTSSYALCKSAGRVEGIKPGTVRAGVQAWFTNKLTGTWTSVATTGYGTHMAWEPTSWLRGDYLTHVAWSNDMFTTRMVTNLVDGVWVPTGQIETNYAPFYYRTALIHPHIVIGASHWFPTNGTTIMFIDAENNHHRAVMTNRVRVVFTNTIDGLYGDIMLGQLDRDIPDSIKPLYFLQDDYADYLGDGESITSSSFSDAYLARTPALFVCQHRSVNLFGYSRGMTNSSFVYFSTVTNAPFGSVTAYGEGGDSGNAIVMPCGDGRFALLTCFYGSGVGPFSRSPAVFPYFRDAVTAMGGSLTYTDFGAWGYTKIR